MSVVIHDFEVVPDTSNDRNQPQTKKQDTAKSSKKMLSDYELEQMLKRQKARMERVFAH
jgi:hypothetical protein